MRGENSPHGNFKQWMFQNVLPTPFLETTQVCGLTENTILHRNIRFGQTSLIPISLIQRQRKMISIFGCINKKLFKTD